MRYIWITHTYRVSQKNPLLTLEANISGLTYWEKSDQFWKLCPQLSFEHKNKSILFQHNWEIRFLKSGFKEITGTKTKLIVNMVQVIVIKSKELFLEQLVLECLPWLFFSDIYILSGFDICLNNGMEYVSLKFPNSADTARIHYATTDFAKSTGQARCGVQEANIILPLLCLCTLSSFILSSWVIIYIHILFV